MTKEENKPKKKNGSILFYPSLVMALFLIAVNFKIVSKTSSIPIVGIEISPQYVTPVLFLITIVLFFLYANSKEPVKIERRHSKKRPADIEGIILLIINGIAIITTFFTYFPTHRIIEVFVFLLVGFGTATTADLAISGIFSIRTEKEMKEKWLPKIPFAVLCYWKMASRVMLLDIAFFILVLIYHHYCFPYHYVWLIAFVVPFSFILLNLFLFGIACLFRMDKLKKRQLKQFRCFDKAMEIHDRDYLLFGHKKIPVLENQPKIITATQQQDINSIKSLLQEGIDPDTQNAIGWTALMQAAADNNIEIVKLMIDHGANLNIENVYGRTALHFACGYGYFDMVKLLVKHGAIINAENDHSLKPPLYAAIEGGYLDLVKFLLENGANCKFKNMHGEDALKVAQKHNQIEIAKIIRIYLRNNSSPKPYTYIESLLNSKESS
ncbi:MAG: ankyrin repeat domain-containing protein [Bacteroidales bacterium]